MPTADELLRAFESIGESARARPMVRPGGIPSPNDLARSFMAAEEAAGIRPAAQAAKAAEPLTQRSGLLQRGFQALTRWRAPAAAAAAVEATKAGATAETAVAAAAAKKGPKFLAKKMPRLFTRVLPAIAAGQAALGAGLSVAANRTLSSSQDDAVNLLRKYGMRVTRGTEETGSDMDLSDTYGWFTGAKLLSPIETAQRAWAGEGDPEWTDPRSDINQLDVYTPEGHRITGGMGNERAAAQMKRQVDLFRAAGLMDNKVRAERGLPPVYSPADLLRNARKK